MNLPDTDFERTIYESDVLLVSSRNRWDSDWSTSVDVWDKQSESLLMSFSKVCSIAKIGNGKMGFALQHKEILPGEEEGFACVTIEYETLESALRRHNEEI